MKSDRYAFVIHDHARRTMMILEQGTRKQCQAAMDSFIEKKRYLGMTETAMIVKAVGEAVDG